MVTPSKEKQDEKQTIGLAETLDRKGVVAVTITGQFSPE